MGFKWTWVATALVISTAAEAAKGKGPLDIELPAVWPMEAASDPSAIVSFTHATRFLIHASDLGLAGPVASVETELERVGLGDDMPARPERFDGYLAVFDESGSLGSVQGCEYGMCNAYGVLPQNGAIKVEADEGGRPARIEWTTHSHRRRGPIMRLTSVAMIDTADEERAIRVYDWDGALRSRIETEISETGSHAKFVRFVPYEPEPTSPRESDLQVHWTSAADFDSAGRLSRFASPRLFDEARFRWASEREVTASMQARVDGTPRHIEHQILLDDRGNVIEVRQSLDGAPHGRFRYEYEYDDHGNWTRQVGLALIERFGEASFEPEYVAFREIRYHDGAGAEE